MDEHSGFLSAYLLDGKGGARSIGQDQINNAPANGEILWLHWNRKLPETPAWLDEHSGLSPLICEALLQEEARPRCLAVGTGLLAVLRGVNLNPGHDVEEMVSIRLWIEPGRIITLRSQALMAAHDLRDAFANNEGPETEGRFLSDLAANLVARMSPVLDELNESVDQIEEDIIETNNGETGSRNLRGRLSNIRRLAIAMRRHLSPQRDVLSRLQTERLPWLDEMDRARLRETADRVTRFVEDLDAARERAAVTQEELVGHMSEKMNRNMYILSLVAAVFLPLGLITGLLGINVGGIPGTENPWAFLIVCVFLSFLSAGMVWAFRKIFRL